MDMGLQETVGMLAEKEKCPPVPNGTFRRGMMEKWNRSSAFRSSFFTPNEIRGYKKRPGESFYNSSDDFNSSDEFFIIIEFRNFIFYSNQLYPLSGSPVGMPVAQTAKRIINHKTPNHEKTSILTVHYSLFTSHALFPGSAKL